MLNRGSLSPGVGYSLGWLRSSGQSGESPRDTTGTVLEPDKPKAATCPANPLTTHRHDLEMHPGCTVAHRGPEVPEERRLSLGSALPLPPGLAPTLLRPG